MHSIKPGRGPSAMGAIVGIATEEGDPLNTAFGRDKLAEPSGASVTGKLAELNALRDQGVISEAEYAAQRTRILNSI